MVSILYVGIGIIVLVILYLVYVFNRMIVLRNRVENAWSQIDVQLKKRHDLIPNLIRTVKGYAKHEKGVFESVTKARTQAIKTEGVKKQAQAENMITSALKSVFAVAENYPKLRASENFQMLQEELAGVENKIAYARQFYNDTTLKYDNSISKFPGNLFATLFGFEPREYFEVETQAEKAVPRIEF